MTRFTNTFDSWAEGAQITKAGTAADGTQISDIVLNNVSVGSGSSPSALAKAAAAVQGNRGLEITLAASASYLRYDEPNPGPRGSIRRTYKHFANPTAEQTISSMRSASALVCNINVSTTGQLRIAPSATILNPSNFQMTPGNVYTFEAVAAKGTGATDGQVEFYVYSADGTTLLNGGYVNPAVNTGTLDINTFRFGGATTSGGWTVDQMDSIQGGALASGLWGPIPAGAAPTLNVGRPANNIVDLRASTPGDASSLTYLTPTKVSGPTLTVTSITPGVWLFSQDSSSASVYAVSAKQGDTQVTQQNITIPAAAAATAVRRTRLNGSGLWV